MTNDFLEGHFPDAPEDASERRRKRLRDRRLLLAVIGVLVLALVAVLAVVAWYGKVTYDAVDRVQRDPDLMPTHSARPTPAPTKEGAENPPMNIVVMGTDARNPDERGRSDVLLLLHLNGDRDSGYLISFPRDYWVDIPGRGTAKINAAYSWGGTALTIHTLEELLDVPIDHAAVIDFDGFKHVIDALGGVTVHNRFPSAQGDHTFPEGDVFLDGESALRFVRERKNLPGGDLSRAERQREVFSAVADKLLSRDILTNPVAFRDSVTTLGENFTVDEELDNQGIFDLGRSLGLRRSGDIRLLQAPTAGFGTSADKQSYVRVDEAQLAALADALRNDTMDEYYERYVG